MATSSDESLKAPKNVNRQRSRSRPILRQATLILPRTGERVKRRVTLQTPDSGPNGHVAHDGNDLYDGPPDDSTDSIPGLRHMPSRGLRREAKEKKWPMVKRKAWEVWAFWISKTGQGVLKCSLAYLLGSMATFVPGIAALLGQQDGKHMVATITVYFHPARSGGSMFEAVLLAIVAFAYAAGVSFSSMGVSFLFGRTLDMMMLGHIIVLIVFCGGGLGFVGWIKQRLSSPLVNVACSLTSLALITVLTKEGAVQDSTFSDDKIVQVMKMIVMGCLATIAVCFLIRPVSARKELRESLILVTDSFGDMLSSITHSFLTGSEEELQEESFISASKKYRDTFSKLDKQLKEAKFEHCFLGSEKEYHIEAKLVGCMKRLAQNIGGLRSAATTQFTLMSQSNAPGGATPEASMFSSTLDESNSVSDALKTTFPENYSLLTAIDEVSDEDSRSNADHESSAQTSQVLPTVQQPTEIFERFIMHLGPSMKSLAYTLRHILNDLPFGSAPDFEIAVNPQFRSSLEEALELYRHARTEALKLLYRQKDFAKDRPLAVEADFEEVAASCGHFSFSLQDFAEEMQTYLIVLDDLKVETRVAYPRRTWTWLKFWHGWISQKSREPDKGHHSPTGHDIEAADEHLSPSPGINALQEDDSLYAPLFKKGSLKPTISYRLWKFLRWIRRDDIKFAVKVGIGASLYALPAFLISTRPFYQHWRGEWGLLSYMLVCSMTIGASNTTGLSRFLGTCLGGVCAILSWTASQGNVFILALFGWLMSLWTSHMIVAQGKGPTGRFIMLTYNLSVLYAYSLSVKDDEDDDDEGGTNPIITDIVLHRVVAVLSGCLWGLIVTRLVWPISARRRFKDGLSVLWLRMGLIWKRDPLAMLLEGESPDAYMNLREEFELNRFVSHLESLRTSAATEFELKGPFPTAASDRILKATGRMLDAFHAMNVVIMKDSKASKGEAEILKFTAPERAHLCSRISHLFQVLASSMKLEFPLSDAMPKTDTARDRLLAKIYAFRRNEKVSGGLTDDDYALLYAYGRDESSTPVDLRPTMPDIDPAALSRNDSFATPALPSSISGKLGNASGLGSQKPSKPTNTAQRIDLEPLYGSLKIAIGEHWTEYKEALSGFLLGHLNQNELSNRIDYFVKTSPITENVHNQFIVGIYGNVARELPEPGVAPFVSSTDKPTAPSKLASGDAVEHKLKGEVMQLPARERRRLKEVPEVDRSDFTRDQMSLYHTAKQFRLPDSAPAGAGGAHKTNWDLEIRKRYGQPLALETGEFPDTEAIQGRMVPICYEESIPNGCASNCAEFLGVALEHYVKEILSAIYKRTRTNLPSSSGYGVTTHKFKKQLRSEEQALSNGSIFRATTASMLPVELKEAHDRAPLAMSDLRLGLGMGECGLGQMPSVIAKVNNGYLDGELEGHWREEQQSKLRPRDSNAMEGILRPSSLAMNGVNGGHSSNGMQTHDGANDDMDWGWDGGGTADREELNNILDECLAFGQ
ncbi:hypothetical protein MMC25_003050 [Agyrium rufum]|nr:hypothetical protein [Agyrium rufum]